MTEPETTVDPGREELREQLARAMHTRNIGEDCWDQLLESGPKRQARVYRDAADAVMPVIDELHERARQMAAVTNTFSDENARLRAELETANARIAEFTARKSEIADAAGGGQT